MLVTGICRALSNLGYRVAPFKGQNMALNSFVTKDGGEIGRAQASQAMAARVEPEIAMNPVLLKPTSISSSSVVVMGQHSHELSALDYQRRKAELAPVVDAAFVDLSSRYDAVICEGAGSPAEINLLENDLVNLGFASRVGVNALVVGDIDRGGVFASLYGTKMILPPELSGRIKAFVINKFRGDAQLLAPGIEKLVELTSTPMLGVIPHRSGLDNDSEDSLALAELFSARRTHSRDALRVAIVPLAYISNFTDFEPLVFEDDLEVFLLEKPSQIRGSDLVVIPGTKATVSDLENLRDRGYDTAIASHIAMGKGVMGICGGYQIMSSEIQDDIESNSGTVHGLGYIPTETRFEAPKVLTQMRGDVAIGTHHGSFEGYQIHFGRVVQVPGKALLTNVSSGGSAMGSEEGYFDQNIVGTSVHGIFDNDSARQVIMSHFASLVGKQFRSQLRFLDAREKYFDSCAQLVTTHIGLEPILRMLEL